jgi:hypothetical protein
MGQHNVSSFCLKQTHMYQNTPVPTHSRVFITETQFLQTPKSTGKSIHIVQLHSTSTKAWITCNSILPALKRGRERETERDRECVCVCLSVCLSFHLTIFLLYAANVITTPNYNHPNCSSKHITDITQKNRL